MSQFFNSIKDISKNYKKYDAWEQLQADERAQKEYLAKKLEIPKDKLELTTQRAATVVRAAEMMDARSEDNAENMEQFTSFIAAFPPMLIMMAQLPLMKYLSQKITSKNLGLFVSVGSTVLALATAIGTIFWGNAQQKKASRIGRFQAKQNELKGLENFVVYTPEQLEKAKEIAKSIPDKKEQKSFIKMIKELYGVQRDSKAYKKWQKQKDPDEIKKLKAQVLTPTELQKAEEDKELIVDTVKEINIKAEEYSENVENMYDTFGSLSWILAIPLGFGINKILNLAKVSNSRTRNSVSIMVPAITALSIGISGTMAQKKAARVGRYKAREDLLKNPARLMAYSDDEMKSAEHIKAPKQKRGLFKKLTESFKFLGVYAKDNKAYNKYKKTTQKENEKLQEALKQIETTTEQKDAAASLQTNVFRAFDEVDEMSQRYSEDMEAATEAAREIGGTLWSLGSMAALAISGIMFAKGKFPTVRLINGISNIALDSKSSLRKSINDFWNVLKKQDKSKRIEFQRKMLNFRSFEKFLDKPENKAIKDALAPFLEEIKNLGGQAIIKIESDKKRNVTEIFNDLMSNHFKQTRFAKWVRGIVAESAKIWTKNKLNSKGATLPKDVLEGLGFNFSYKNYKTLINTGLVAGLPIFGVIFGVPYAFNAWLTDIQKKSGKIGVMKAMENIDDPRVFAPQKNLELETSI